MCASPCTIWSYFVNQINKGCYSQPTATRQLYSFSLILLGRSSCQPRRWMVHVHGLWSMENWQIFFPDAALETHSTYEANVKIFQHISAFCRQTQHILTNGIMIVMTERYCDILLMYLVVVSSWYSYDDKWDVYIFAIIFIHFNNIWCECDRQNIYQLQTEHTPATDWTY